MTTEHQREDVRGDAPETDSRNVTPFALPDRIAVDAKGYGWRVFDGEDGFWSMVPTTTDNDSIPQPVTWFVPDNRDAQLARTLVDALTDTETCWRRERSGWWVEYLADDGTEAPESEWFWAHDEHDDRLMTPGEIRAWKAAKAATDG